MNIHSWRLVPKAGSLNRLKKVEETIEEPGVGMVQIEVKAIGLNFADIFAVFGLYGATPDGSFIPGLEYSGVVSKVGKGVNNFEEGQRVMGVTRFGAYTTGLNIDQRYIAPMPDDWSFDQGAAYLVQVLTAYYALVELGDLQERQSVLIHSAAGGVGIWANRIAKQFNAYTIGTVGSTFKLEVLNQEKYDKGMVRSRQFYNELIKVLGERPLNIVLECIGGRIFKDSYKALAKEGRLIIYGSARYGQAGASPNYLKLAWKYLLRPKIDPQRMIESNKALMGFNLIYLYENADKLKNMLDALSKMDLGKPLVGHTFDFRNLKEAIQLFQTGKTVGKVVVNV